MALSTTLSHAVQTTQTWLNELVERGELADTNEAVAVLRCVLHQLRDRLTIQEATDLSAQLPLIIRGLYFEGWQPGKVPTKIHTKSEFLAAVINDHFPNAVPVENAVRDVFALLAHHCDPGEISDVIAQLPQQIKDLWPVDAATFRDRAKSGS